MKATIQHQMKVFNANRYEIDGKYIDFYNGDAFVGSSNLQYMKVNEG